MINLYLQWLIKKSQKFSQLRKQLDMELGKGVVEQITEIGICLVSPFSGNGVRTFFRMAQDKRFDTGYFTDFQDLEALAVKRMKGVGDYRPSQRGVVGMCSSSRTSLALRIAWSRTG